MILISLLLSSVLFKPVLSTTCDPGFTLCYSGNVCLRDKYFCDGESDCDDRSDELNCKVIGPNEYWRKAGQAEHYEKCSKAGKFVCRPANDEKAVCISMNATCNGVKDCPLGDDEGGKCSECSITKCDHGCTNTPRGARCHCQQGYTLGKDELSCEEENQCLTRGDVCQQLCESHHKPFVCKCANGYQLEENGHTCRYAKNISSEGYLFISLGDEVREIPLSDYINGTNYARIHKQGGKGRVRSIDFMHRTNQLFIAVSEEYKDVFGELAVFKNGLLTVLRENVLGIGNVAVDWIGGNVFFTQHDPSPVVGISVCTIDGLFCRQIVKGQSRRNPYRDLALHPLRGLMFWIDPIRMDTRILMANMDGTNAQVLLDHALLGPTALTIDPIRNDIYFADGEFHSIHRINLDSRKQTVAVGYILSTKVDMVFFNGLLYWADQHEKSVGMADLKKNNASDHKTLHEFKESPTGLAVNHSLYQPEPSFNPCATLDCSWICVAVPDNNKNLVAKCLCPDGYKESGETCIPPRVFAVEKLNKYSHVSQKLMKDKCKAGVACKNGGKCRKEGAKFVCDCTDSYDGIFCERLKVEMKTGKQESDEIPWSVVLFLCTLLLVFVAGTFFYFFCAKRKVSTDMLARAHGHVARFMRRSQSPTEPYSAFDGESISRKTPEPNQ